MLLESQTNTFDQLLLLGILMRYLGKYLELFEISEGKLTEPSAASVSGPRAESEGVHKESQP